MTAALDAPPRPSRANGQPPAPPGPTGGGDGDGDGHPEPRRMPFDNGILATMFFIGAETMFFAGLVFSFWILRLAAPVWPPPLQPRLPLGVTGANTLVLVASSVMMARGLRGVRRGRTHDGVRGLTIAAGLGVAFLLVQGYEWARLIHFGLTMHSGAYGASFYTLIGTHGVHVAVAVVWLLVTLRLLARGRFVGGGAVALRACAMYWHFVVALWPVLWVSVYLL